MPRRPPCQSSPAARMILAARISSGSASTWATASSTIARSTSRRSWLSRHSSPAIGSAASASAERSRSRARSGCESRPAALMQGARVKPSARAPSVRGSSPAAAQRAAIAGRGRSRIARRPRATRRRLSPTSGTASATVASATRSIPSSGSGARPSPSSRSAKARTTMCTTPAAAGQVLGRPAQRGVGQDAGRAAPAGQVVVEHDRLHAGLGRAGERLDGRGAAVHAHEHPRALARQQVHALGRHPVALGEAARQERAHQPAAPPQRPHQHGRGADAVAVVVAVHGDRLAPPHRARQALGRLGDAGQRLRRGQRPVRRQELPGHGGIAQPAAHQRPGDGLGHLEGVLERGHLREGDPWRPPAHQRPDRSTPSTTQPTRNSARMTPGMAISARPATSVHWANTATTAEPTIRAAAISDRASRLALPCAFSTASVNPSGRIRISMSPSLNSSRSSESWNG